jgi:hypothetical protein
MEFIHSRPDVVRSSNQRWLLDYWNRVRRDGRLPAWQGLEAEEFGAPSADLSFMDVMPANGSARFLIRFHGARIAQLYGRDSCVGKFLDEILPPNYCEAALATYREAVATRLPVYTVADMRDRWRIVHYERLLPFGQDQSEVDHILASLETVSPEGVFDNQALMHAPQRPPAFALCTTIHI